MAVLLAAAGWALLAAAPAGGEPAQGRWDPVSIARAHLSQRAAARAIPLANLDWITKDVRESPGNVHVQLAEAINGIPVAGADSTVTIARGAAAPRFTIERLASFQAVSSAQPAIDAIAARNAALAAVGPAPVLRGTVSSQLVYVPRGLELRLAWEMRIPTLVPLGDWLVDVDAANGAVLGVNNVLTFDSGDVFSSNPFQQSGGTVPPPTDCDSGANANALSSYAESVQLPGITDGQNKLKGQYVDLTAPGIVGAYKAAGQADEPSRLYSYACNDDRFEEVMVYHHIDATQRVIQSLGFIGEAGILDDAPVPAHAHYYAECNAFYSPFDGGLHFGDGNTLDGCPPDAAEDADIVVHEYGHAIQDDVVPGWGLSGNALLAEQSLAMGEGFSDYLAATMLGDPCIGGWGLFAGECLRDVTEVKVYPGDYEACPDLPDGTEEEHCGGKIWSGVLWELSEQLGGDDTARETVLRLVLASHFYLAPLPTFSENLSAILTADQDLYGGAHTATIQSAFASRGITTSAINDFAYYFLRIRHPQNSNLEIRMKVGANLNAPLCEDFIWDNPPGAGSDLFGYVTMTESSCGAFVPPTVAVPWHLEVRDTIGPEQGTLVDFEVTLGNSPLRCLTDDTPLPIAGATVATIDCTIQASAAEFDSDADAVQNLTDNCPLVANADQLNSDALPFGNGPALLGDDATVPAGDIAGDVCDSDDDNDGLGDSDELSPVGCGAFDLSTTVHPNPARGDVTNDDNGDGIPAPMMGADAADDGPSWDTDGDGTLDGYECANGTNPRDRASRPPTLPVDYADDDGDGLTNRWELRGWGTDPSLVDSDGDGLGDCKEAGDVDGNGLFNSTGDFLAYAQAIIFHTGLTQDFDFDKNGFANTTGDFFEVARRLFLGQPCL